MRAELLDRFSSIRSFGHETHIRLSCEQRGYSLPEQRMIVDREDSNGIEDGTHGVIDCGAPPILRKQ